MSKVFAILGLTSDLAARVVLVGDVGGSGLYNIVVLPGAPKQLPSCLVQSAAFGATGHEREGAVKRLRLCHLPFVIALFWAADTCAATIDDVNQWCASNDAVERGKCFAYIRALVDLADLHVEMKTGDQSAKSCFPEEGVSDDKVKDVVRAFFEKALKVHPDLKDFSAAYAIYFALSQAFVCEPEQ